MENNNEVLLKMVLNTWKSYVARADKLIDVLTDQQLMQSIKENRNSGTYLLGHLTAINDAMFPILGLGERLYPELSKIFIDNPDNSTLQKPSIAELRENWKQVNTLLISKLETLPSTQLFEKHNFVTVEDFRNEPHRNKLNVLLSRTNHFAYHLGQLLILVPKNN